MKEIGGYFELELPSPKNNMFDGGIFLSSGRHALEYILRAYPEVKRVWTPYYTCQVVRDTIEKLGLDIVWYSINKDLELTAIPHIEKYDVFLYTNYYGIKDSYTNRLLEIFGDHLIVDNAQALFANPVAQSYYSPRKFLGLPDGGVAFSKYSIPVQTVDVSYDRISHLVKRIDQGAGSGYLDFKENSAKLKNIQMSKMSNLTLTLMRSVDMDKVKKIRLENFNYLHTKLEQINKFHIPNMNELACPMVYPLLTENADLKQSLINNKIFVATYWPNVLDWCDDTTIEYQITKKMLCIPIDQRYNICDMDYIIKIIKINI